MKEVKDKRFAGPFLDPPSSISYSPSIGLVPKDKGTKTRLIFHLSHPRRDKQGKVSNESVNAGILKEDCSVQYPAFDEAVKLCLREGKILSYSKI